MKRLAKTLLILGACTLLAGVACGGLRPPGKYNGVVLFDRWGGCYLYSAIFLMYVPEEQKAVLKEFTGRCMELDVRKVYQPVNPGDGRLEQFTVVGDSQVQAEDASEKVDQVELTASLNLDNSRRPRWKLVVHNRGPEPIQLRADEIALTILTRRPSPPEPFEIFSSPSDGPSMALVTRQSLLGLGVIKWQGEQTNGQQTVAWKVRNQEPDTGVFELPAGAEKRFVVELVLSSGQYDLVFGYGGGVHAARCVASNLIAVDVSAMGVAAVPKVDRK